MLLFYWPHNFSEETGYITGLKKRSSTFWPTSQMGSTSSFHTPDLAGPHPAAQSREGAARPYPAMQWRAFGLVPTWPLRGEGCDLASIQPCGEQGHGLASQEKGAQPIPNQTWQREGGMGWLGGGEHTWPGLKPTAQEKGHGLALTCSMGLGILVVARGGSTGTAPPPPNFPTHGEPHRPDSKTPQATFSPWAKGRVPLS